MSSYFTDPHAFNKIGSQWLTSLRNILLLPFRRTHNVSLKEAIKKYISSKYDQHPQMFAADLDAIDQLRHDTVSTLEPHASGIRKIQAYAAQLVWLGSKFPVDVREAQGKRCVTCADDEIQDRCRVRMVSRIGIQYPPSRFVPAIHLSGSSVITDP